MAFARGRRRRGRRRQAEGGAARQGRGHPEARRSHRAAGKADVKIRKELWFGFSLMAIIIATILIFMPWGNVTNCHLGLLMLALIVVAIMLGFPTAFTLRGLLVFHSMLEFGYNILFAAGSVTAGGCLVILIPPSVLLIVYGATALVFVVQLYAGTFFPGIMLACLYLGYIIIMAKLNPALMPPLPESEKRVPLTPFAQAQSQRGRHALAGSWR